MKRRVISLLVALLLTCTMPIAAFAQEDWRLLYEEQCDVNMPELNMYFYPMDEDMQVVPNVSLVNTKVTATLGEEALKIERIESVKTEGTTYIIGVNNSAQLTGFGYLSSVKQGLSYWIESMSSKDKLVLFYYTDSQSLLLDGTETRTAAANGISTMSTDTAKPDTLAAIRFAMQLKKESREDFPSRHVCVLFDDGSFATENEYTLANLQETLRMEELPVNVVCHKRLNADQVMDFTHPIGGIAVETNGYNAEKEMMELHSALENAYVLRMRASNNRVEPDVRKLKVEMEWNEKVYTLEKDQRISRSIPDTTNPVLGTVYLQDERKLLMKVSEAVTGADNKDNFSLMTTDNTRITISEAAYDAETLEITLLLEKALEEGDYTLSLQNITDVSQECNPVVCENGVDAVTLSYRSWETGTNEGILISDEAPPENTSEATQEPILGLNFLEEVDSWILWACGGGVVVIVCIVLVIVLRAKKKKKKREEEQRELERSRKEIEESRADQPEVSDWPERNEGNEVTVPPIHTPAASWERESDDTRPPIVEGRAEDFVAQIYMTLNNGLTRNETINIRDSFVVGRSTKNCSLVVNDRMMSGRHFSLTPADGKLMICDLGSTNGTLVNGVRLAHPRPLQDGDVVLAGETKIQVRYKRQ